MDTLGALIIAGVALEATVQILRNIWDADIRSSWNVTRGLVVIVALVAVIVFSDPPWNLVAGTGLDFGIEVVGTVMSGLALARVAAWLHDLYARALR